MDLKLEVLVLPVSDVDRAKAFYEQLGFRLDADLRVTDGYRVIQLTPPGSPASIIFGEGITEAAPGSVQGLHLVVTDIVAARTELIGKGADVSEIFHEQTGIFHQAGTIGRVAGLDPKRSSYGSFASFSDPDGNGWVLQEIVTRLPGRRAPQRPTTRERSSSTRSRRPQRLTACTRPKTSAACTTRSGRSGMRTTW
ncbi:MAG: VOC family protein [Rhodoglobus sp.]